MTTPSQLASLATLSDSDVLVIEDDSETSGEPVKKVSLATLKSWLQSNLSFAPFTKSYASPAQTITAGGQLVLAHGMGVEPKFVQFLLECKTAEDGYSIGDRILVERSTTNRETAVILDTTNITIRFTNQVNAMVTGAKTTGVLVGLVDSNWDLYVFAYA